MPGRGVGPPEWEKLGATASPEPIRTSATTTDKTEDNAAAAGTTNAAVTR